MKIRPQNWRNSTVGLTFKRSMHRDGVGSSVARAVPGPGIELAPFLGTRFAAYGGRAGWALVTIGAVSAAAGIALASDPADIALNAVFSILLGVGATALGIYSQWRRTIGALDEQRQRIARNLHDGLAQELAYIKMETQRMAAREPDARVARLALAAERALEESRRAIDSLRSGGEDPLHVEILELADELASREGARVSVRVDPAIKLSTTDREELLCIMREAITNGLRHGRATEVALELSGGDGIRMAVRDNGAGFVPGGPRRRGGFGLASMRARADELGGNLYVQSAPGEGTLVEVTLP
jgi:signal transduction histidine kinase